MTSAELLAVSQQELGLYQELWAVYTRLAEGLRTADGDLDALTHDGQRGAAVTVALRELATTLAPHRLSTESVHEDVTTIWRQSACLAAAAAEANRQVQAAARQRQQAVGVQLGRMQANAAGAARYRHAGF